VLRTGTLLEIVVAAPHSTGELAPYASTAIAHARLAGVPTDRIVNCWSLERLLEWAQSRSG
jgi:hypothetical protein